MSANTIQSFHLPPYHEIPDVGLYLDQVTRYINDRSKKAMWQGLSKNSISGTRSVTSSLCP